MIIFYFLFSTTVIIALNCRSTEYLSQTNIIEKIQFSDAYIRQFILSISKELKLYLNTTLNQLDLITKNYEICPTNISVVVDDLRLNFNAFYNNISSQILPFPNGTKYEELINNKCVVNYVNIQDIFNMGYIQMFTFISTEFTNIISYIERLSELTQTCICHLNFLNIFSNIKYPHCTRVDVEVSHLRNIIVFEKQALTILSTRDYSTNSIYFLEYFNNISSSPSGMLIEECGTVNGSYVKQINSVYQSYFYINCQIAIFRTTLYNMIINYSNIINQHLSFLSAKINDLTNPWLVSRSTYLYSTKINELFFLISGVGVDQLNTIFSNGLSYIYGGVETGLSYNCEYENCHGYCYSFFNTSGEYSTCRSHGLLSYNCIWHGGVCHVSCDTGDLCNEYKACDFSRRTGCLANRHR